MKRVVLSMVMLLLLVPIFIACGGETAQPTPTTVPANTSVPVENTPVPAAPTLDTSGQDAHITVQHILIGFKDAVGFQGNVPPKAATRTQDQAKTLAYDLFAKAKAGDDFDKLVTDNTDDAPPGIYSLANNGVQPGSKDEFPRNQMVAAFGDVGFSLKMGEIGIADYDPQKSPFGYHIIRRVPTPPTPTPETKPAGEDDRVTVQHILIGFKDAVGFQGNIPPKAATRTQDQAKTLAYDLFAKAKAGEDFDKLVTDNTDDAPPGVYTMTNKGITATPPDEFDRNQLVPAFGDIGFTLKVGEIGIADYDAQKSPFGYHIIKRLK